MNANLLSFTGIAVDHFALTFFFVLPAELHPSTINVLSNRLALVEG